MAHVREFSESGLLASIAFIINLKIKLFPCVGDYYNIVCFICDMYKFMKNILHKSFLAQPKDTLIHFIHKII
jgi:hypothetical protein